MDLRTRVFEKTWNDQAKVSGLLNDAGLNPSDYTFDGGASTLWANLIPVLRDRLELAKVLRVLQPRVGKPLAGTVDELASYYEKQAQERAYNRLRTRLHEDMEVALARLREAPNHLTTLLMPVHPSAARIAGMRSWITGCAKAVVRAQKTGAQVSHEDEAAQIEELATQLAAVSDAFRLYASMLEKSRSANEAEQGQPAHSLAAAAEEERLLLSWRRSLRASIQQLITGLQSDS